MSVTLVNGDKVLVTTDASGRSSAAVLPREDGTQPMVQTSQMGKDLYVYPEDASQAIAEGKVDEQLFNVTGLIRQGYDDTHRHAAAHRHLPEQCERCRKRAGGPSRGRAGPSGA
ncbi:hypothetical protein [Streptomyces sp. NPDC048496]|uniref:hypothetical protein n=1 Tax=Streptomyces sp. NPDC048496 TaxID=3365558 RepID=UPI0037221B9F